MINRGMISNTVAALQRADLLASSSKISLNLNFPAANFSIISTFFLPSSVAQRFWGISGFQGVSRGFVRL